MVECKMRVRVKNSLLHKLGFVQHPYFYTPWHSLFCWISIKSRFAELVCTVTLNIFNPPVNFPNSAGLRIRVTVRITVTLTIILTNTSLAILWSSVRALLHQTRKWYKILHIAKFSLGSSCHVQTRYGTYPIHREKSLRDVDCKSYWAGHGPTLFCLCRQGQRLRWGHGGIVPLKYLGGGMKVLLSPNV